MKALVSDVLDLLGTILDVVFWQMEMILYSSEWINTK